MRAIVIRFSSLGDCVLLCPLLGHLKDGGAGEVIVVTKSGYADIFHHAHGVDRVIAFDSAGGIHSLSRIARDLGRSDDTIVIDAHNNWRSRFLSWRLGGAAIRFDKHYRERLGLIVFKRATTLPTILEQYGALATAAGLPPAPAVPGGLRVSDDALARVTVPDGAVAVAPGSRWPVKRWPAARFLELARSLASRGRHVVLVGDRHDAVIAGGIAAELGPGACTDATGERAIMDAAAWISRCSAFVGNDSGLMHLAEAVGVPVVAVFGPTVREFGYFPSLARSRSVERAVACRPCSRNGARPCPRRVQVCIDIDPDSVGRALDAVLDGGEGERRIILEGHA